MIEKPTLGQPISTITVTCPTCGTVLTIFEPNYQRALKESNWRQLGPRKLWHSPNCTPETAGDPKTPILSTQEVGVKQLTYTFICPVNNQQVTLFTKRRRSAITQIRDIHGWRLTSSGWVSPSGRLGAFSAPRQSARKI